MGHTVGSHQLEVELESDRQGGSTVLTLEEEVRSLEQASRHEAEDVIRDILVLTDRLIHLVIHGRR